MSHRSSSTRKDHYTVAVISAMEFEMSAFRYMLDREHPPLPIEPGDSNMYVLGEIGGLNIVLACLPGSQGKSSAATVATNLERTFHSIQHRFLIGVGGGVPSDQHDIRLGDVVISMPEGIHGGVVEYDLGKDTEDSFTRKGFLVPPPALLRSVAYRMKSDHRVNGNKVNEFISHMVKRGTRLRVYNRPDKPDILYKANYSHIPGETSCLRCGKAPENILFRKCRDFEAPEVHYGLIASGDRVIKSGTKRDMIVEDAGDVLCFEMEAAGIAAALPCIVIRGIADYADSHKNDGWHNYAAATAAASAKEMIYYLARGEPSASVNAIPDQGFAASASGWGTQSTFHGMGLQQTGPGTISIGRDLQIGGR